MLRVYPCNTLNQNTVYLLFITVGTQANEQNSYHQICKKNMQDRLIKINSSPMKRSS